MIPAIYDTNDEVIYSNKFICIRSSDKTTLIEHKL